MKDSRKYISLGRCPHCRCLLWCLVGLAWQSWLADMDVRCHGCDERFEAARLLPAGDDN